MSEIDRDVLETRLRRRIGATLDVLATNPPVRRRPLVAHARRRRPSTALIVAAAFIVVASVGGVAYQREVQRVPLHSVAGAAASPFIARASGTATPVPSMLSHAAGAAAARPGSPGPAGPVGPRCATGANGGATDAGVTSTSIAVAATVSTSGPTEYRDGQAVAGIQAAVNAVNQAGGICGRLLHLATVEDGGSAAAGRSDIDTLVDSGSYFALVVPSAPGLVAASQGGDIDRAGMPVVGYDAITVPALDDPWAWPVTAPLTAAMRTMVHDAAHRGAHSFAVLYDTQLPGAAAAAGAFRAQVQRDGGTLSSSCVIALSAQGDMSSAYADFDRNCGWHSAGGGVDYVGVALSPAAQLDWEMQADGDPDGAYYGVRRDGSGEGAGSSTQTLLQSDLMSGCDDWCRHVWSWTSVLPWDAPFTGQADVQGFAPACAAVSGCNPTQQYAEAGWASVQMLVDALRAIGPQVTRSALRQWLDGASLDTGTVLPVAFQRGTHLGAQSLRPAVAGPGGLAWTEPAATDPCPRCADPSIS